MEVDFLESCLLRLNLEATFHACVRSQTWTTLSAATIREGRSFPASRRSGNIESVEGGLPLIRGSCPQPLFAWHVIEAQYLSAWLDLGGWC